MHPNEELVRRGFAAFAEGDMATLTELMSEDVVWVSESGGKLRAVSRAGTQCSPGGR